MRLCFVFCFLNRTLLNKLKIRKLDPQNGKVLGANTMIVIAGIPSDRPCLFLECEHEKSKRDPYSVTWVIYCIWSSPNEKVKCLRRCADLWIRRSHYWAVLGISQTSSLPPHWKHHLSGNRECRQLSIFFSCIHCTNISQ